MNIGPALVPAVVVGIMPLVYALLAKPGQRAPAVDEAGMAHLRMPGIYLVMGWVCLGIGAIGTVGMAISSAVEADAPPWYGALLIALVFAAIGIGGLFLRKAYYHHAVSFDRAVLSVTDDRGRTEQMTWNELADGELKNKARILVLRSRDGRKVKINPHLIGSEALLDALKQNTRLPVDGWRAQLAKPKGSW